MRFSTAFELALLVGAIAVAGQAIIGPVVLGAAIGVVFMLIGAAFARRRRERILEDERLRQQARAEWARDELDAYGR